MILDQQYNTTSAGMVAFPDWPYAVQEEQPTALQESTIIVGSSSTTIAMTGAIEDGN